MGTLSGRRCILRSLMVLGLLLITVGCGGAPDNTITISYTFPIVPITISVDTDGHISFSVSAQIVTELGDLTVTAGSSVTAFSGPDNALILTIRHKQDGNLVDSGYQIDTGGVGSADVQGNISEVKVGWNGKSNSIFIDASQGDITKIVIEGAATSGDTQPPSSQNTQAPTAPPPLTIKSFTVDRTHVPILSYVNFTVTFNRAWGDQDSVQLKLYFGNSFDCSNQNVCTVGLVAPSPLTKTFVAELVDSTGLAVFTFPSSITVTWSAPEPANPADDLLCTSSTCAEIEG